MRTRHHTVALLILALALPAAAAATDPDDDDSRVVIVGDDDERIVLSLAGSELTITSDGEQGTSVRMVDIEQVGRLVEDAMADLGDHLALLEDLQLDVHMGQDNRLDVSWDDQTFEVDVDAIVTQVNAALRAGMRELDRESWTAKRDRDRTEDELRRELDALKAELADLRRELEARDGD